VAHKKLGYLKGVTPRLPSDAVAEAGGVAGGARRVIMDGRGHLVDVTDAATGGTTPGVVRNSGIDADQLRRHQANLRRFQFMDRPGGMPRGPLA